MLKLSGLTLDSWTMDAKTYLTLNQMKEATSYMNTPESFGTGGHIGKPTIKFDAAECANYNGIQKELWTGSGLNVCVYGGCKEFQSRRLIYIFVVVVVIATDSNKHTTGMTIGIALGVAAFVGIIIFVMMRRRHTKTAKELENVREFYSGMDTPTISNGDDKSAGAAAVGLDLSQLTRVRIDIKHIKAQQKLGSGAFADVWRGTFHDEVVAIKKLHPNRTSLEQLKAFVDEINLMASFESPYIVKLIGAAWTRPLDIHCVMEFMDSGDLKDYLDSNHSIPWPEKIVHLLSIAEGLVYLHSMDIVHRDIKSRNVLLDSTKGTKLTDFGISKEDIQATMTVGVGTFRWMAPEVLQDKHYTIAADIYSLGVIMSELDTQCIPYHEIRNPMNGQPIADSALIGKVLAGEIQPSFTRNCPLWFLDLATQCLSHDPDERPTAMQASHIVRNFIHRSEDGGLV
ncbi:unnamed protein product [Aphanomyces euteiches]